MRSVVPDGVWLTLIKKPLIVWAAVNAVYLFGFFAGYKATAFWQGLPFLATSLAATFVGYRSGWRSAQRAQDRRDWEHSPDAAEWTPED